MANVIVLNWSLVVGLIWPEMASAMDGDGDALVSSSTNWPGHRLGVMGRIGFIPLCIGTFNRSDTFYSFFECNDMHVY